MIEGVTRLSPTTKLRLVGRIWVEYLAVRLVLSRVPLPALVERSSPKAGGRAPTVEPKRLGRLVYRALGPARHRCLTTALVFLRMLGRQGMRADLVIGLPPEPTGHEAHAWVEIDGAEVGPPPGRGPHRELARYPAGKKAPGI